MDFLKMKLDFKELATNLATILVVAILILNFAYLVRSTATGSYFLDTPLPIASFYVGQYTNGTYYAVNGSNWDNFLVSDNASLVINTCTANLGGSSHEFNRVVLQGHFVLTASILLYDYTWLDLSQAYLVLSVGATYPAIRNEDQTNGNTMMKITGGQINGTKYEGTGSSSAKGVYIYNNNQNMNPSSVIAIYDLVLYNFYGNGFDIQLYGGDGMELYSCKMKNYGGSDCTQIAFNLKGGDSKIVGGGANSYRENMVLTGGTFLVSDFYFGGACDGATSEACLYVYSDSRSQFHNCLVDANKKGAVYLKDSDFLLFDAFRIRVTNALDANNTYVGFKMENCDNCVFGSPVYIGRYDLTVTDFLKYGIEESGTSDYNVYVGCNCRDVATAGIILVGANSKVAASWNMTTWIS